MDAFLSDVRHILRRWRGKPTLAATAILTLTLGIGMTTAIFSIVDGVLLRPLPWPDADRLVTAWIVRPEWRLNPVLAASAERGVVSWPNFRELQQHSRTLESVGIWTTARPILDGPSPLQVYAMRMSSSFLPTLGTSVFAGRNFTPNEDDDPSDAVLISYEAWQARFGGDPQILGRLITLDEAPKRVVGVLPPRFRFEGQPPEFVFPLGEANKSGRNRGNHSYRAVLRLKAGISLEQAHADTEPILRMEEPPSKRTSKLVSLAEHQLGEARRPLLVLLAAAALLLAVACANVAGLLLGDLQSRRHELAVRAALGANRVRLARQLLVESTVLVAIASAAGLLLAWIALPALVALAPERLPRLETVTIDYRVLGFSLAAAVVTTVLAGGAAAVTATSASPGSALAEGGRGASRRQRGQRLIVVAEIALAMVLLIGASLFAQTVRRMHAQPIGFQPENVIVIGLRQPSSMNAGLQPAAVRARITEIESHLATTPGVMSVAGVSSAPFGGGYGSNGIEIEGKKLQPQPSARRQIVTESFFRTMGMPILRGRSFQPADSSSAKQAVVSVEFERRYLDGDAVGKRFRLNQDWHEIIGVVGNTKQLEVTDEDEPTFFALMRQLSGWSISQYVVKTAGDPATVMPSIREVLRAYDGRLIVSTMETMDALVERSIAEERYRALLGAMFGISALLLAAIGVYGLLARDVADRKREIGVRLALGARAGDIVRLIGLQGVALVGAGLLIGVPVAIAAGHGIRSLLFGVTPTAPGVFAAVGFTLLGAALVATIIPARRASRIDPIVSLRGA